MGLSQGVRLGPYQIVAPLGAGGMGAVYKATDTRLGRAVAIKVLADRASNDPQQRLRFEQEARAVSALNHPNICVLYDVGCETPSGGRPSGDDSTTPSGPVRFLVMEHLEGETLSKRLREGGVSFDQALDIGAQVADALAKAHRHGVIHRDLKPGNIMLTRSGTGVHAKLLDFGLAKLRQAPDPDLASTHSKHEIDTRPGAMLGTLPYMPPEQLDGKAVDGKADIFALGCVLYEMLTGRRAFRGDSEASVISAIMAHEPEPLATLRPATPAALDHLVRRCLQKDPDQRAESAHDLAEELRWMREAHRTTSNGGGHPMRRATDPLSNSGQPFQDSQAPTPRPRTRRVVFALGLIAVAVAAYAGVAYRQGWWPLRPDPFRGVTPQPVTSQQGLATEPAVSPDGSLVAYTFVSDAGTTPHIWLAAISGGDSEPLTEGSEPDGSPAWNHDRSLVYFTRQRGTQRQIWSVSPLSRQSALVVANAAHPSVSWDGSHLAFVREVNGYTRVFVAPKDDASQATQVSHDGEGTWDHSHPSWSHDGRWLCYHAQYALWVVSSDGLGARPLTSEGVSATDPVWSPDDRWVYYTSAAGGIPALWKVPFKGGRPERVRSGSNAEREPSISRSGAVLAFSTGSVDRNIVLQTITGGTSEQEFGAVGHESMPRVTPGAEAIVFVSGRTASENELRVKHLLEGRLTDDILDTALTKHGEGEVVHPAVSADGRSVAYYRVVNGQRDVWTIPLGGGPSVRITTHKANDIQPAWSPDGKWLAFASERGGMRDIWTVQIADGRPVSGSEKQITRGDWHAEAPEWSPDGSEIAYVREPGSAEAEVWVVQKDGVGKPRRVTTGAGAVRVRWPRKEQMVVNGKWGAHVFSLHIVDPATGVSAPFDPPLVLGYDETSYDFDIDLDRGLFVFTSGGKRQGNIWILSARR